MNKFLSLTKVQLKDFLTRYQKGMNIKNNKLGKLLMLAIIVTLALPAVTLTIPLYDGFAQVGMPELTITFLYVGAVMIMFFTGVPFIVSIFFYSKDLKFLSSLPVREDTLVFAKLSAVYIYLLGIGSLLVGPTLVVFGIKSGFTLSLIFFGILALLLAPILPLLISAVIILLISPIISNSRYRNIFSIIAGFLFVFVIIGIQLGISRFQTNPEYMQQVLTSSDGLLGFVGLRFPPSVWLTKMIMGSALDGLYFLLANIVMILGLQGLARIFYQRAMRAFNQGGAALRSGKIYYMKRSPGMQLLRRNVLIILKQPTFFMNTAMSLLVPVIMFGIMAFTGEASLAMLKAPELQPYMVLIFAGIISSPAIIANLSSTAITREGHAFWETRILPISARMNIQYRVVTTLVFNFVGALLLLIVSVIVLPISWTDFLIGIYFCIAINLLFGMADIIINIFRPLLNWTHPTAAVKNNMNIMISLVLRVVVGGLLFLIYTQVPGINLGMDMLLIVVSTIFIVLYLGTRYYVYNYLTDRFSSINV